MWDVEELADRDPGRVDRRGAGSLGVCDSERVVPGFLERLREGQLIASVVADFVLGREDTADPTGEGASFFRAGAVVAEAEIPVAVVEFLNHELVPGLIADLSSSQLPVLVVIVRYYP